MDKVVFVFVAIYVLSSVPTEAQKNTINNFCNDGCNDNICKGQPNDTALPNSESCTQFFICIDEHPVPNTCPPGQWFNPIDCLCDSSENDECNEDDEFECPEEGIYFFPHDEYCDKFIMCFAGFPILRHCAKGLYFDRELLTCNLPEYAECELEVCPPANETEKMVFLPSDSDCEKFYICFNGEPVEQRCASGIHWNPITNQCDFPENVNCTRPQLPECPEPHEIECKDGIYFEPHPNACDHFFVCSLGVSILLECAPGFYFDVDNNWCNFPEYVQCEGDGNRSVDAQISINVEDLEIIDSVHFE